MNRLLGLVLAGGLLLGLASTSRTQVVVSLGGRGPAVLAGQPYGYGYGYNTNATGYAYSSYRYAPPLGYQTFSSRTYVQAVPSYGNAPRAFAPTYAAPAAGYYGRAYSGMGYAPTAGAYAPYGGYATPNTGYGFVNPGNYPRNTGMNFYGYGITGP